MKKSVTPATVGALSRDTRIAAGLSQSALGKRIGASRFWVAQFEKGKPSAELGLALKALHALGLTVRVEPRGAANVREHARNDRARVPGTAALPAIDLGQIIATSTVAAKAPSAAGWPVVSAGRSPFRGS